MNPLISFRARPHPFSFRPLSLFALVAGLGVLATAPPAGAADEAFDVLGGPGSRAPLRLSVYATAGSILAHLAPATNRDRVLERFDRLGVTHVFLEGRRGDEYVPPATLAEVRDLLRARGIATSGGIATVPGANFGTRQQGPLGWLNWESPKTRADVAGFFRENAPLFDRLIVDDFFCTGDQSPESDRARGHRSWSDYRRDLMASLVQPLIFEPTRAARPQTRLIIKFPQWYDRFHLFGYDPVRLAPPFDAVWVGTEVRNPLTRRMGFVQPTEGYINFSWIRAAVGEKVVGAWFDHIECTPRNFVDQAFLSVLAGARDLTLFQLGDVVADHPGDALLAEKLPALRELAAQVRAHESRRRGVPYYKPPASDAADNLYLMDYLAMIGWPILPVATFPTNAPVLCLGAQAAADPAIGPRLTAALARGATVIVTPAFLRLAGPTVAALAGVTVAPEPDAAVADQLQIDASLRPAAAQVRRSLPGTPAGSVPLLTTQPHGRGQLAVLNVRTFSEADFRASNEWLLAPQPLGWSTLATPIAHELQQLVLAPLGVRGATPAGVALHLFEGAACFYNFNPAPAEVRWNDHDLRLEAHECRWLTATTAGGL